MNKKVLVGVGIGCGSLVLLALIAVGVGAWWVKRQVGDSMSTMMEAGQKMQEMGREQAALNQQHPFTPPPEGEVFAVSEARLLDYLAVRETALPVYAEFEKKAKDFEAEHKDEKQPDMRAAMQATSMMTGLLSQVHRAYLEGLKKHAMSPREYHTITQTLYSSLMTDMTEQASEATQAAREEALQGVRERLKDDTLTAEQRTALEEEERQLQASGEEPAQAPALSAASKAALAANLKLLEKYKERINNAESLALDSVLIGEAPEELPAGQAQEKP